MSPVLRVGLTGGIGSGKSTVCQLFSHNQVPVIDADKIVHDLLRRDQAGYNAVKAYFGDRVVTGDGELDRSYLRNLVFTDVSMKKVLENLLHPMVFDEIHNQVLQLQTGYCIISIPLLVESGSRHLVDRVLVVEAPEELRIERAASRDNTTCEEIQTIIASQATPEQRQAIADEIITNDGDMESLRQQVDKLHNLYKKTARELRYRSTYKS